MDFDARPVNAGNPWSRVSKAAPATSSRPSEYERFAHFRAGVRARYQLNLAPRLPRLLPGHFPSTRLGHPVGVGGPPTTTRSAPSRTYAPAELTGTTETSRNRPAPAMASATSLVFPNIDCRR